MGNPNSGGGSGLGNLGASPGDRTGAECRSEGFAPGISFHLKTVPPGETLGGAVQPDCPDIGDCAIDGLSDFVLSLLSLGRPVAGVGLAGPATEGSGSARPYKLPRTKLEEGGGDQWWRKN